jgi:hypothetical protein
LLAPLTESIYLVADTEVIWLGRAGAALHARAMLTSASLPLPGELLAFDAAALRPWRPPAPSASADPVAVRGACHGLLTRIRRGAPPDTAPLGLGALLVGGALAFPLGAAAPHAMALAAACEADAPAGAAMVADPLLGLGPGLTPSGDDFVGGTFFARMLLATPLRLDAAAWVEAGETLIERARHRTHPVSVALLSDMVSGSGHAPLHELGCALASREDPGRALEAVRRLVRIGHSSGWDMLAGFMAGVLGREALLTR